MSPETQSKKEERPPIVVVLGHVDHGKSTLLDYIRKSNTVENEAGGITQHVAAYEVVHKNEHGDQKKITFLDTPGHEAFGAMRDRSTDVADIAILIVSAEDGVREQTIEALNSIKKQEIPFVVAINKIDKPSANVEKTISNLSEHEVYLEGRGGNTPYTELSAKSGQGVDLLLELLLLVAELEELTGESNVPAEGYVVESHRDPKIGISATVLIKNGTLSQGMYVATSDGIAPTRIMQDFLDQPIKSATFSSPIRIIGWSNPPTVGAKFSSFAKKGDADNFMEIQPKADIVSTDNTLEAEDENSEIVYIPIIIKSDVVGSADAIKHEIDKLKDEKVNIRIVKSDVGAISENDIKAAGGDSRTIVIGFNTKVENGVNELAERDDITIATFDIIYKLAEWLEEEIKKRKPQIEEKKLQGTATILKLFSQTKKSQVLGGRVESGRVAVGDQVNILRRDEQIGTGIIKELQSQKQSAKEVLSGNEFGMKLETTTEVAPKDTIELT